MDEIDRVILKELRSDARMTFRDLGERVGLSANAAADRVRALVAAKTIRRFTTEIDALAVGTRLTAFVDLRLSTGMPASAFEQALRTMEGGASAALTTGEFDYTLRVEVGGEAGLVTLIERLRSNGVAQTQSRIVLRETVFG